MTGLLGVLLMCVIAPVGASGELRAVAWGAGPSTATTTTTTTITTRTTTATPSTTAIATTPAITAASPELREPFGVPRPARVVGAAAPDGGLREPFGPSRAIAPVAAPPFVVRDTGLREPFARR